jgi:hypothetical protein
MKFFLWCRFLPLLALSQPQIGDVGQVFDETRFVPRFPEMKEWAKAGVQGGIPPRHQSQIKKILMP